MYPAFRPLIVLMLACVAWLAWLPATAQQTIRIPEEQLEKINDMPTNPMEGVDMSMPADGSDFFPRFFEIVEDITDQAQFSGSVPELIAEGVHGQTPIAREVPVVWGLRVSGSWSSRTLRGEGALRAIDLAALGVEPGQMITTVMRTDAQEWPFMLGAFVPAAGGEGTRQLVTRPGNDEGAQTTLGLHGMTAHMFDPRRLDPLARGNRPYTERTAGHVRVNTRDAYRIHFSTSYRELDEDGRPTGRIGSFSGWICEAEAYERDPDNCVYDEFRIVSHTPTVDRANVNPQYPALTVVFSERVGLSDLAENFTLYTEEESGGREVVEGVWRESKEVGDWREEAARVASSLTMPDGLSCSVQNTTGTDLRALTQPSLQRAGDPHEYVFVPSAPLRPGTIYEAGIKGGEDGLQARYGDEHLESDHTWRFSTLLHLQEQHDQDWYPLGPELFPEGLPPPQQHPLELAVYQPVRDPRLVMGKPALTRLYVDWSEHDSISKAWQPDKFEFEVVTSTYHARPMAQRNTPARQGRFMWLEPQMAFDKEDRRHARHTVNLFGWLPRPDDAGEMEVVACPHDPFPFPMAEAETRQEHPVEIWDYDPGQLNIHYVVARTGAWSGRKGIPGNAAEFIGDVMRAAERLVPEFLPYRSARSHAIDTPADNADIRRATRQDMKGVLDRHGIGKVPMALGLPYIAGEKHDDNLRMRYAAYIRTVQRQMEERLGPEDIVVLVVPRDLLYVLDRGTGTVVTQRGLGISNMRAGLFSGKLGYRSRAVLMVIDPDAESVALEGESESGFNAAAMVHEFGHVLSLDHNPGDVGEVAPPEGRREPGIDGFRLAPGGLSGWNKHSEEGNAQSDTLVSLMWPVVVSPDVVMLTPGEYASVQNDLHGTSARSFGWNHAPQMERSAWLASAAGATRLPHTGSPQSPLLAMSQAATAQPAMLPTLAATATGRARAGQAAAAGPAAPRLIVSGMIAPDGQGLVIDPPRLLDVAPEAGEGPFRVELLDADGDVLRSGAFDLEPVSTSPENAASGAAWEPDNPMFWPEFRVALQPHEGAVALVVREGEDELVRLELPASPPRLRLAEAGPVRVGADGATLRWSVEAGVEAAYDVEYSPTGQAPWRPMALGQEEPSIALEADRLQPGPAPHLRITAMSGLHGVQQLVPLVLTRGPVPRVELPDPESALAGAPATLWFDAEPLASRVESHIQLRDAAGAVVPVEYFFLPGRGGLSLLPEDPLRPGETYSVHVTAGLPDRYGNVLEDDHRWSFETAAADP